MATVVNNKDFQRILALPRRGGYDVAALARDFTEALSIPGGGMVLREVQAAMLKEAYELGGGFFPVGVGHGKTLPSLLAPVLLGAERPLLFVPAQLRDQTIDQVLPEMSKHWALPENLIVESYSTLSTVNGADLLMNYKPDLIIADEMHRLKRRQSARTRRFIQYFAKYPETKFIGLSGTITKNSLLDYWHLILFALKDKAPLPMRYPDVMDWQDAINPQGDGRKVSAGALRQFCEPGETIRSGYRRRLTDTLGVVGTEETAIGNSLNIYTHSPEVPPKVQGALATMRESWETPSGELLREEMDYYRHMREMAAGFYYQWIWPDGKPIQEWLRPRREWRAFVRDMLNRRFKGVDSPLQVARACESGRFDNTAYLAWKAAEPLYKPVTEDIWISEFLVDELIQLADTIGECIIWVWHDALGKALQRKGIRYIGGGPKSGKLVNTIKGTVALSAAAHSTGKNLQRYSKNILASIPFGGVQCEQLFGRTHRLGQENDEVEFHVFQHTQELRNAWNKVKKEAQYIEQTTGQKQKVNIGRQSQWKTH